MKDWIWAQLDRLRVWMILKRMPARRIEKVSRMCRRIYPYGFHG